MTNIFFDTEFTRPFTPHDESKEYPHPHPKTLISLGFISDCGKVFYAENANCKKEECSQFVIDSVLPLLDGGSKRVPYGRLAHHLRAYIESFDDEVVLLSDAPTYDFAYVEIIFNIYGWPENLNREPKTLFFDSTIKQTRFKNGVKNAFKSLKLRQHHALDDAVANREGYRSAIMRGF